jgi:phosphoribosylanthranilate isomerase
MVSIKICGLTSLDDARRAVELGADYLGFVLYRKSPRYVPAPRLQAIAEALPERARMVGVFVNEAPAIVRQLAHACRLHAVQVHGDEDAGDFGGMPVPVWRAVRLVEGRWTPDPAAWSVDRYVMDATTTEYGGSGVRVDWDEAAGFAHARRAMLAGGLDATNVAEAIRRVRPLGVDVASGVESGPGVKDPRKVAAFIEAARAAGKTLGMMEEMS